jgi:hypothetical protein
MNTFSSFKKFKPFNSTCFLPRDAGGGSKEVLEPSAAVERFERLEPFQFWRKS